MTKHQDLTAQFIAAGAERKEARSQATLLLRLRRAYKKSQENAPVQGAMETAITWTPALLASIPDEMLLSEAQRRRARQRKTYTGGAVWASHNPATSRCRCAACNKKREGK